MCPFDIERSFAGPTRIGQWKTVATDLIDDAQTGRSRDAELFVENF